MTDDDLLALDKSGFLPGPGENEAEFIARVERTKKKFESGNWIPEPHWDWVRTYLSELFDVKPLYICAFYSNKNLAPWQGAASWIDGRRLDSVQLRKALKKGSYLGLYRREEILAHEAVHAARSGFNESVYEEFFAYMTSEVKWRRILGPIVRRPWEIWPLFIFLILGVFSPLFYWGASIWLIFGFTRLIRNHTTLNRAGNEILKHLPDLKLMRSVLLRLTDEEIQGFAKGRDFLATAKNRNCLRWRIINCYLRSLKGVNL